MSRLKKLPSGTPESANQCVQARSLKVEILLDHDDRPFAFALRYRMACALDRAWRSAPPCSVWNGWMVLLPVELSNFVHDFHELCYPELVSRLAQASLYHVRHAFGSLSFYSEKEIKVPFIESKNRSVRRRCDSVWCEAVARKRYSGTAGAQEIIDNAAERWPGLLFKRIGDSRHRYIQMQNVV